MSPKEAIRDPVFQLNLLVWMAMDQPAQGFRVRPLFSQHGFQLHYIEQPFPFPTELRREIAVAAAALNLEIKLEPEPELTIQRPADCQAIYFEAKAQGFSTASSNAKQARGHLLACGPAFAEVYTPLTKALLDYVVPAGDSTEMRRCLAELKTELAAAKLETGSYTVDGLSVRETDLIYHLDEPLRALLPGSAPEIAVMTDLAPDTDPSPLLLIYSDEDCSDATRRGHYRRVLQNQAWANLLCTLHGKESGQVIEVSAPELLLSTTNGVFSFLGRERQKSMGLVIAENVFRRIADYWKEKLPNKVRLVGKTITLDFSNATDREAILDWLEDVKRTGFDDQKPPDNAQLDLIPPD